MDNPDIVVARLAAGGVGIVRRADALGQGVSVDEARWRRESGLLIPVHRGILRHAAVPLTWQGRLSAAILAGGPDAVASHRSAARLHGLRGVPRWRPEVTTPATDLPRATGVHFHRTNLLESIDVRLADGLACTAVPRTLLDLGAVLPFEMVLETIEDAVIRGLVSEAQLRSVLERVGGRGRRGTASLRAALEGGVPDERLESELERRLLALLPPDHGLELQLELTCADGRKVRLDAGCTRRMIAVEANGHRWHGTSSQLRRDMARRRSIQASGWEHYEYGWADVTETPDATRAELLEICRVGGP